MPAYRKRVPQMRVPTNQLHIELPESWDALAQKYSVWRYQLSASQDAYRRHAAGPNFYASFTNAYKEQIDRPFYYYTFEKPQATLYALLPAGHTAQPWQYHFGKPQDVEVAEITGEPVTWDELQPHVVLKLMLALCFFENGPRLNGNPERERRVCQSKFYLRVKDTFSGKRLIAVNVDPRVESVGDQHTLRLEVEANTFAKADPARVGSYAALGTFYELFASRGHNYLRQLRPGQVATFAGDMYRQADANGKRTHADWHHNGSKKNPYQYQESRSYQVQHVQERLGDFLRQYGFGVAPAEEAMRFLAPRPSPLPLQRLPVVQVVDNRLNRDTVPVAAYLTWLNGHVFKSDTSEYLLKFDLVAADKITSERPVLALTDADKKAFVTDRQAGLLALAGHQDPYRVLYDQLGSTVKQTLNVNLHEVEKFVSPADYLNYALPMPAAAPASEAGPETDEAAKARRKAVKTLANLNLKVDVCLSELWLKWVIAGKSAAPPADCLPLLNTLTDEWAFLTDNTLLYFEKGQFRFADMAPPAGKQFLKTRFVDWKQLKRQFMDRQAKYADKLDSDLKAEEAFRKAHFVLVGQQAFELERTEAIAMPNWPAIRAIKERDPAASAKKQEALGVYAGGIWYNQAAQRYVVGGTGSSKEASATGHHIYQIHSYPEATEAPQHLVTLLSLLTVTFVRNKQFTVWPYPFDLLRLHRDVVMPTA